VEEWFLHHMFPSDVSSLSLLGRLQGTIGGLLELGWRSHNPQPLPGHVARTIPMQHVKSAIWDGSKVLSEDCWS
jgi:hypothetical protein